MIEVIEEKKYWDDFISSFDESDLYHTFDYHMIAKEDGKPVLLKYTHNNVSICLPLLIRDIPNTSFNDATSVYGYPGPLCKNISDNFDGAHFKSELLQYFSSNNIVSVFSRLNPFMPIQHRILESIGEINNKGQVVSIDLKKPIDQQRQEFGKRLKGQLNKARRHCRVIKAENDEELQEFIDIYHENMDRVNAKPMYYFDDEYFRVIAKSNSFHTETLLAVHNETREVMGASMFIYKNSVVHYHLSGTKTEYLPLMPTKLLIDEMRIKASKMGLSHFNLGGGLSSANDSLLHFKSSFSKDMSDFYVWKLIVNPEVYNKLTKELHTQQNSDFFPLYRCSNPLVINTK
ncbi:peptidoglycan bridge formation glycyltransferase FemA/FemB family protein [[Muricauda] lutisoli]|uniref:Peptidoglycan bridge formation glycyltransferase FemA/FemB family protein n=1 Tax=[Muricauda] lutisoli TaxID=2816035 RepID=A0ABS3EVC5_9FLAO|nr:peptidoglycan bridge formation glycyltransferase FemA/FemB family protein [[Muricauda] lutisoli]MBO0330194.1 peptidoglycan bridge formation glycyltransferase FemA/FemB family protein [[Muricauda] lutisoli]